MTTVVLTPDANADDGHGDGTYTASSPYLANDIGIRFPTAGIPQGATILSAILTLYQYDEGHTASSYTLKFSDEDDPAQIVDFTDFSNRPRTSGVAWSVSGFAGPSMPETSPDIASILQGVVNRAGFTDNSSALLLFIERTTVNSMVVYAHDAGSSPVFPTLTVEFAGEASSASGSESSSSVSTSSVSSSSSSPATSSSSSSDSVSSLSSQSSISSLSSLSTSSQSGTSSSSSVAASRGRRCRGCCGDCDAQKETFGGPDAESPGAFDEIGGSDYDVVSGKLTAVIGGQLIATTVHPGGATAPQRVRRTFIRTDTSQHARAILSWVDENNHIRAEVATVNGCDVLRLVQVSGGVETDLNTDPQTIGDGAELNQIHMLEACLDPGSYPDTTDIFRAKLRLASGKIYSVRSEDQYDLGGGDRGGIDDSTGVQTTFFAFGWMEDDETQGKGRCPNCEGPCEIESDLFPNGSETACKWEGGTMRVFHPELLTDHRVEAIVSLSNGGMAEVRVNSLRDESSYHWARVSIVSGTTVRLSIGKDGTTLVTDERPIAADETLPLTVTICVEYFLDNLLACGGGLRAEAYSAAIDGGIYVGRSGGTFTSFVFSKSDERCPHCDCGPFISMECCEGEDELDLPPYIILRAEGIANGWCTGCGAANRSWILPWFDIPTEHACYRPPDGASDDLQGPEIAVAGDPIIPCFNTLFGTSLRFVPNFAVCFRSAPACNNNFNTFINWQETSAFWELSPVFPGTHPYGSVDDSVLCDHVPTRYEIRAVINGSFPLMWWAAVPFTRHPADFVDEPLAPGAWRISATGTDPTGPQAPICNIESSTLYATAVG